MKSASGPSLGHKVFAGNTIRRLYSFFAFCFLLLFFLRSAEGDPGAFPPRVFPEKDDLVQREELGVNPITAPSIQHLLVKLESFSPIPEDFIETNPRQILFPNRFQTALHFGTLVADGLLLTIAEDEEDLYDLSRSLIRKAKSLDVSDRLTQRGKSLLELSSKGDWLGMRRELILAQEDVEQSMMDLKDDALTDIISLGGWIRGFQLACTVIDNSYVPQRARMLVEPEIMDYYIERLENLPPRLRKTGLVQDMTKTLKQAREIISQAPEPSSKDVHQLKLLADHLFADIVTPVSPKGEQLPTPAS